MCTIRQLWTLPQSGEWTCEDGLNFSDFTSFLSVELSEVEFSAQLQKVEEAIFESDRDPYTVDGMTTKVAAVTHLARYSY